ncbi:hypothetical protein KPA96_13955 [Burkholderia cenocepacia]|uniref:hypothetical protein n=1 Tax=Burkholderia cenocepacia TaxID=95486 RepID=UPI0028656E6E|nr:hypothetical protein [Burkholderia cenocepacia]MCB4346868.1 hypothetical protein [Burkholderia vietnamiensis]MDR8076762.1 hypothetical protein [Burkholderia cenocepacia]
MTLRKPTDNKFFMALVGFVLAFPTTFILANVGASFANVSMTALAVFMVVALLSFGFGIKTFFKSVMA